MIFGAGFIFFMTIKVVLLVIFVNEYNIWFFLSLQIDLIFIAGVFLYSLIKIRHIAKKFRININKCYMLMHFFSIILLLITWILDLAFYSM